MSNFKQQLKSSDPFDFDEWADLASNDPAGFEQRRKNCIEQFIDRIPVSRQRRLRGLQFRIDMERKKARTPLGACIKLSSMMWDSVTADNGFVSTVKKLIEPGIKGGAPASLSAQQKPTQQESAKILYFDRNKIKH